jgi:HPt (histidine-containing phosphotransfer) domain-containing protein
MIFSLIDRLKKNAAKDNPDLTKPDLSRLNLSPAEDKADVPQDAPDMATWLERDIELISTTWVAFCDDPSHKHWTEFSKAAHNLHGASGVYGGGALTRLTTSLQRLLESQVSAMDNQALVNLHVQACQAWAYGNEDARTDLADAVCEALEIQVRRVI